MSCRKSITIIDNETKEQTVISTDAYVIFYSQGEEEIKVHGYLALKFFAPYIVKYGMGLFSKMQEKMK